VFILNTDLRLLACDAYLVPVSRTMHVDKAWSVPSSELPQRPHAFGKDVLAIACRPKTAHEQQERREARLRTYEPPVRILSSVLSDGVKLRVPDLVASLRQFLALAAAEVGGRPSRFGRALPLIALPIFGAGLASDEQLALADQSELGESIRAQLDELLAFARAHAVDIALCTIDSAAFGAALNARRRACPEFEASVPAGARDPERYRAEVARLAQLCLRGQLSLFLGAGVSINAGLPSWPQLLDLLGREVGFDDAARAAMRQLDPLEAATVIAARAGGERELKQLVSTVVGSAKRHSLQHALLSGLPFRGAITTNYDELFEQAHRCAGGDLAVLPTQVGTVREAWLLKMHGSVDRPDSIVLTRADYLRFAKEQAASEGVLQGLLLTQHVLFVGFSMRDENWCRISASVKAPFQPSGGTWGRARAVAALSGAAQHARLGARERYEPRARAAGGGDHGGHGIGAGARPPPGGGGAHAAGNGRAVLLGTVLSLMHDDVLDELWADLLHVTPLDLLATEQPLAAAGAMASHARSLEIFLDNVVSEVESSRCRILLNPKFTALLSPRKRALRLALEQFLASLTDEAKASRAFAQLLDTLLFMGLRTEALRALVSDQTLEGPYHYRMAKLAYTLPDNVRSYRYVLARPRNSGGGSNGGGRLGYAVGGQRGGGATKTAGGGGGGAAGKLPTRTSQE
jgi:hypothetical protein